jgi:hypothetical protein
MEAARTSETLVQLYQTTRCYNPEDSHLHVTIKFLRPFVSLCYRNCTDCQMFCYLRPFYSSKIAVSTYKMQTVSDLG